MLWALTTPVLEARTDFGAISPVMVLISRIFRSAMLFSSAFTGEIVGAEMRAKIVMSEKNRVMESTVIP